MFRGLHQFSEFRNKPGHTNPVLPCGVPQTCGINLKFERGAMYGLRTYFRNDTRFALQFGKRAFHQHHGTHFSRICKQASRIPDRK